MLELIPLEQAQEIIIEKVRPVDEELVFVAQALNRVLAKDVFAGINLPPFDRSPLDGYAIRAEDISQASAEQPVTLKISAEIPAGHFPETSLVPGEAIKILTGAPIPPGADEIVRQEDVQTEGGYVTFFRPVKAFRNYCFAGEDIKKDDRILAKGTLLGPAEIGLLAGVGQAEVPVYKRPQIALISTGSELLDVKEAIRPGKIYNSNLYAFSAILQDAGAAPMPMGIVEDDPQKAADMIEKGLAEAEMVITTGGASVGDYDVLKDALKLIGAELLFWRVNIRPGTPVVAAVKNGKLMLCLSGNPSASYVTYQLLIRPAINKMRGIHNWSLKWTSAMMEDAFLKKTTQRRFLKGQVFFEDGAVKVRLTGHQSPGSLGSSIGCNALIDIPSGTEALEKGTRVRTVLL